MKEQVKKYLLCGGTLLCLGAVSAGLLSGVNLLTAPIIDAANESKANAAFLEVFPAAKKFSKKSYFASEDEQKKLEDAGVAKVYVDYYVIAYEDDAGSKELGKVFHGKIAGRDAELELLVGFAMENGKSSLVKIAMIQCNDSFKANFEQNYLNPVNQGNRKYDDVAGVGATITSTAVSKVVAEADKLFSALSGGIVEDPAAWNNALFADKGYKLLAASKDVAGDSTFTKYYSLADDDLLHNEAARFYVGSEGDFTAAIAVSAEGFEGGYILSSSFADVDYKTSPSYSASSLPSGITGTALANMGQKAVELLSAGGGLLTLGKQAMNLYKGAASFTKRDLHLAISKIENLGIDDYAWPSENKKHEIYASYSVLDAEGKELGVVYEAEFHVVKDESGSDETEAHGGLYFLLGFSGEDYDNPTLTNIVALENSFSRAAQLQKGCIDVFNRGEDHSWNAFKTACAAEAQVEFGDLGATISSHALYAVANLERQNYADMKGGK